ncbi:diacylglycerol kinase family protein [Amorphus sp. 3PC139-8]|uniref:diacylglycerol/lipid kinase family protein n=1 Tax=Amorphus sp. 3PC139-8 TaxID=2735676 RepID=UPI00345D06C5
MRCFVIINPRAGAGLDDPDFSATIRGLFRRAGIDATFADDGADIAAQIDEARASGLPIVAVVGGDGTVMAAAQAFVGTETTLAIIPAGTMNVLARELGVPQARDIAVALIASGEARAIDVGTVNGRIFLVNSVLGAPSRLARRREGFRGRSSGRFYARLIRAGLRALKRYPAMGVRIETEGEERPMRTRALAVVVNDYAEGFGKVLTRASLDGGQLVIYALKPITPWRLIGLALSMVMGRWRNDQRLLRLPVQSARITTRRKRVRVMNDGETVLITPPLDYAIRPKALKVLVPHGTGFRSTSAPATAPIPAAS